MTVRGTVLITGGTGVIGSNLAGRLATEGYRVLVVSSSARFSVPLAIPDKFKENVELITGDINDADTVKELVCQSDVIFHKSATTGMAGAVENASDFVQANIAVTANLVDALRSTKNNVRKVVLGSSTSVYGEGNYECSACGVVRPSLRYKFNFDVTGGWDPCCPTCGGTIVPVATAEDVVRKGESIYAAIKKSQEDLLAGTCNVRNTTLFVFRYSTVIGAGQSWHNPYTRFLDLLASGTAPELNEDGLQTRNFIFAEDVIEANMLALASSLEGVFRLNVVSPEQTRLVDFSETLSKAMARKLDQPAISPKITGKFLPGDVRHCFADHRQIEAKLNFVARKNFAQGVDELIDWFAESKGLSRKSKAGRMETSRSESV